MHYQSLLGKLCPYSFTKSYVQGNHLIKNAGFLNSKNEDVPTQLFLTRF